MNLHDIFHWQKASGGIQIITLPKGTPMNKLLSILSALEGIEASVLASKVPVVSSGIGGEILTVALISEEEIATFLKALQAVKGASTPSPASPTPAA